MAHWDIASFVIGLLLGMIIMLILVWISYNTRSFLFTYCARSTPVCAGADYYNDPGEALAHDAGLTASDILSLNESGELMYNRVPRVHDCNPGSNQLVPVLYPQYCQFYNSGSSFGATYRETFYNSNVYELRTGYGPQEMTTSGNCQPTGTSFTGGAPLIKWDPSPLPR